MVENRRDFEAGRLGDALKSYPYLTYQETPWCSYNGEAADHIFALVTSGGLYLKDEQPPFAAAGIDGDPSFRRIPKTVRSRELAISHPHYDHSLAEQDINCVFPLEHFLAMEAEGVAWPLPTTASAMSTMWFPWRSRPHRRFWRTCGRRG